MCQWINSTSWTSSISLNGAAGKSTQKQLKKTKKLEFLYQPSWIYRNKSNLLTELVTICITNSKNAMRCLVRATESATDSKSWFALHQHDAKKTLVSLHIGELLALVLLAYICHIFTQKLINVLQRRNWHYKQKQPNINLSRSSSCINVVLEAKMDCGLFK